MLIAESINIIHQKSENASNVNCRIYKKKKTLPPKPVIADIAKILADAARRLIVVRNPSAAN